MTDSKITSSTVRDDFNSLEAVLHYTRAAVSLGLWESERILIERFFADRTAPLIEAGCGAGRATLGLWALGYRNITAFDFAEELLEQADSLARERGAGAIRFFHADATTPEVCQLLDYKRSRGDSLRGGAACGARRSLVRRPGPQDAQASARDPGALGTTRPTLKAVARDRERSPLREPIDSARGPELVEGRRDSARTPNPVDGQRDHSPDPSLRSLAGLQIAGAERSQFAGAIFLFNGLMQIPGRANRRAAMSHLHVVCREGAPFIFTSHDRNDTREEAQLWASERAAWQAGTQDPRLVEFGDRYMESTDGRIFMHLPDQAEILEDLAAAGWRLEFTAMRREIARESRAVREFSDECRFWVARKG